MLLGKVGISVVGTFVLAGAVLMSEGIITVRVHEKQKDGHNLFIMAPGLLVPVGMRFVPREYLREPAELVRPWAPTIRAALAEIEKCPDTTFVEVEAPGQHVRVSKDGGAIVVDVDDEENTVHVSMPLRAMESTINQLIEAGPAS